MTAVLFGLVLACLAVIVGSLRTARRDRTAAGFARSRSETRLEAMLKALPDHVYEFDRLGRTFQPSQADVAQGPLGLSPAGRSVVELLPAEASNAVTSAIAEAAGSGRSTGRIFSLTREAETRWYELSVAAIGDHRDHDCRFLALFRDITEAKNLEHQLIQSQKMEAVGRLAGGIAHDFNNILQAIIGFSELILAKEGEGPDVGEYLNIIKDSAVKAASLTQHLLEYSREQVPAPRVVDADQLIDESLQTLKRVLGENISITHESDSRANSVRIDPGQFGQMITTLAVNARDAMPAGGEIRIKVTRVEVRGTSPLQPGEMRPDEYVLIRIADTGTGMDQETLSHLFEPGRGAGLGLSIVSGVVKQSGGYISVDSRQGGGTSFSIYLPRVRGEG